jgi:PIN domain nuclease of toxin-antitoxin system
MGMCDGRTLTIGNRAAHRCLAPIAPCNPELVYRQIAGSGITIVPFHGEDATLAAGLVPLTRAFGLSLGDRACLALAHRHGIAAITADHAWSKIDLPIPVRVIRPATPR